MTAIETLKYLVNKTESEVPEGSKLVSVNIPVDILKEIIQTAQQWIPCKLGLPEDLEEVNVTWVNHKPEPYYEFVKDKPCTASAVYFRGDWYWYSSTCADILAEYGENDIEKVDDAIEITAWKAIGEPWKGEQP